MIARDDMRQGEREGEYTISGREMDRLLAVQQRLIIGPCKLPRLRNRGNQAEFPSSEFNSREYK